MSVLALPLLFEAVSRRFRDEGSNVVIVFGRREKCKQLNQGPGRANRIVFDPGAEGRVGDYSAVKRPGRNPRSFGTLVEYATVYCWGYDGDDRNNEMAHYEAARLLHDELFRALHIESHTTVQSRLSFSSPIWVEPERERFFGYELKFTLGISSMLPDHDFTETSANADIDYDLVLP